MTEALNVDARSHILSAVNKIVEWSSLGREFYVNVHRTGASPGQRRRYLYHVNAPESSQMVTDFATRQPVLGVVDALLQWLQSGVELQVRVFERKRSDRLAPVSEASSRTMPSMSLANPVVDDVVREYPPLRLVR